VFDGAVMVDQPTKLALHKVRLYGIGCCIHSGDAVLAVKSQKFLNPLLDKSPGATQGRCLFSEYFQLKGVRATFFN
jgi:hypothetical protein